MIAFSAVFYILTMLIVAFSQAFWGFWAAMVVMTFGELIFSPTATNFVADLAPADKRGRYLGLYGLIWYVATATGPLGAGFLSDNWAPNAWLAGAVLALLALIGFLWLDKRWKPGPAGKRRTGT